MRAYDCIVHVHWHVGSDGRVGSFETLFGRLSAFVSAEIVVRCFPIARIHSIRSAAECPFAKFVKMP